MNAKTSLDSRARISNLILVAIAATFSLTAACSAAPGGDAQRDDPQSESSAETDRNEDPNGAPAPLPAHARSVVDPTSPLPDPAPSGGGATPHPGSEHRGKPHGETRQ